MSCTRPLTYRLPLAMSLPEVPDSLDEQSTRVYLQDLRRRLESAFSDAGVVTTDMQSPPIVHVTRTSSQSLSAGTPAKVQFNATRYDTHSYWDDASYRYYPRVAGYYRVTWAVRFDAESGGCNICTATLYVDGVADKAAEAINATTTAALVVSGSTIVYCDGERYLEIWAATTAATTIPGDAAYTHLTIEHIGDNYPGILNGTDAATGTGAGGSGSCSVGGGGVSAGKHQIWIAAGAMRGTIQTSPASSCSVLTQKAQGVATAPDLITLDFDSSTAESAEFCLALPKSWNEGTVTFRPYWSHTGGAGFGVVWALDALAVGDGENMNLARGTAQTSTDTGGTSDYLYVGPESAAITIAGSPAANNLCFFRIQRTPADAGDTLSVDARLHGIVLTITTDASNDN